MKSKIVILSLAFLIICSASVYAKNLSIGIKASTLGAGPEVEVSFLDFLGVRSGYNYWDYSYSGKKDDINYDFDLKLKSVPIFLDIHPFKGSFRLTGGILYNRNRVDAVATTSDTYEIGNRTYTGSDLGRLNGEFTFNKTSPYAGLGWDTSFGRDKVLGFVFDLGVVFSGSPKVNLYADGPITDPSNPLYNQFQQDMETEEKNLQDDLDTFKYYPVIGIGVNFRF